ncbi:MAG: hypothetical protein ACP5RQ_02090 [Candidatus Micrarchaeia archaeon]
MYACSSYVTSWNFYAYLIIIISFFAIAVLYAISNFIPGSTRSKLRSFAKSELVQTFISLFLIVVLIAITQLACNLTLSTGKDPFSFSEEYVSNLLSSPNGGGLQLMTSLFTYSYIYTIISGIFDYGARILNGYIEGYLSSSTYVTPIPGYSPGMYYGAVSSLMLDLFSPLVLMGVALLFVQYIALIVSQAAAFTLLLPIALILRAVAFSGKDLKRAANAAIAIALALYVVFPLTIVFNANAFSWLTTVCTTSTQQNCNPSAIYISKPITLYSDTYFAQSTSGSFNLAGSSVNMNLNSFGFSNLFPWSQLGNLPYYMTHTTAVLGEIIVDISVFLFKTIFMLAIDLTISLSFAMGLSNALDAGIGGASSFWSSL